MQEIYYPSSDNKTTIHACIWPSEGETKAVLQIIHGMAEYAERYAPFAEFLNAHGITVCAEDHLGHGKSVFDEHCYSYFAERKGYASVLSDIRALTEFVKPKYEGVPYFVMGHSMGSFFCRKYISLYGGELDGAIVMGTGYQPAIVTGTAKFLTRFVALFKGWKHKSKFIDNLAFGAYNKKFEHRTQYDWLSHDESNVDNYIADKLCGITFTCNAFFGLFSILGEACKSKTFALTDKKLPIYLVAGSDDPVGAFSKGVIKVYEKYCKCGVEDVGLTLYNGCRHEILNDDCALQVYEDIMQFITDKIKG